MLFIQGLGAGKAGWALQRVATAPWYQAIAHDNRGAGRSDKPHTPYSLEQMADDAIAVLDHAGIENAHIVGASMGTGRLPIRVRVLSTTRSAASPRGRSMTCMGGSASSTVTVT